MRRVGVLLEAANDIEAARSFYGARDKSIGDYFVDSLVSDIESLTIFHELGERV